MFKYTLTSINSKRDIYGNTSWAFVYINEDTKEVRGTICGSDSNIRSIVTAAGWDWSTVYYTNREMKIREFNKFTKGWDYAGCTPKELFDFINKKLC